MAKADTWMPFYVGDYLRDTMHLSTVEHGAYLLLIMAYWMKGGPLPNDDEKLARIAQRSHSDWSAIRPTLSEFFQVTTVWTHKRIEAELKKAAELTEAKRRAGLKGNMKRWGSSQSDRTAMPVRVANASQDGPPSPSPSLGLIPEAGAPTHPPEPLARAITPNGGGFHKRNGDGVGGLEPRWPTMRQVREECTKAIAADPDLAREMPGAIVAHLLKFVGMGNIANKAAPRTDLTPDKFCQLWDQALIDADVGAIRDPVAILTTRLQLKPPTPKRTGR